MLQTSAFVPWLFEAARIGLDPQDLSQLQQGDVVAELAGEHNRYGVRVRGVGRVPGVLAAAAPHRAERAAPCRAGRYRGALTVGGVEKVGVYRHRRLR
jgi:hypothetical protein